MIMPFEQIAIDHGVDAMLMDYWTEARQGIEWMRADTLAYKTAAESLRYRKAFHGLSVLDRWP